MSAAKTARYQGQILLQGHLDPAVFAARVGIGELEGLDGPRQIVEDIAGDLAQEFLRGCELALRRQSPPPRRCRGPRALLGRR